MWMTPPPNFAVPVYPAYLIDEKNKDELRLLPEMVVTPKAPPVCFVHANDDRWSAAGSALIYLEYKKLGLPRRSPHLRQRRPRLRHAQKRTARQRLARPSRRVDEKHGLAGIKAPRSGARPTAAVPSSEAKRNPLHSRPFAHHSLHSRKTKSPAPSGAARVPPPPSPQVDPPSCSASPPASHSSSLGDHESPLNHHHSDLKNGFSS
jgi:hypothetical protein